MAERVRPITRSGRDQLADRLDDAWRGVFRAYNTAAREGMEGYADDLLGILNRIVELQEDVADRRARPRAIVRNGQQRLR